MAVTARTSDSPGTTMPDFTLPDVVTGAPFARESLAGASAVLVAFICRHCPYVVHMRDELVAISRAYAARGLRTVAISSNDAATYPDDAPDKLREMAVSCGFGFPMLHDESQATARAFDAVCTPDLFLYDGALRLYYRGRLDDSTPGNGKPVTGADLRGALDLLFAGKPAPAAPQPSMGCSIKWKSA